MKEWIKIGIAIVVCIVGFTIYNELFPNYKIETKTELVADSTAIDSLQSQVSYWETIADSLRREVKDTVIINAPVAVNDSVNSYTSYYADSTISASWESRVKGELQRQIFTYILKQQKVVDNKETITITNTKTYRETITRTLQPKPYFSIGAELGEHTFGPILSYTTAKQYNLFYRYDVNTGSHNIGFTMPIRFNLNPFK